MTLPYTIAARKSASCCSKLYCCSSGGGGMTRWPCSTRGDFPLPGRRFECLCGACSSCAWFLITSLSASRTPPLVSAVFPGDLEACRAERSEERPRLKEDPLVSVSCPASVAPVIVFAWASVTFAALGNTADAQAGTQNAPLVDTAGLTAEIGCSYDEFRRCKFAGLLLLLDAEAVPPLGKLPLGEGDAKRIDWGDGEVVHPIDVVPSGRSLRPPIGSVFCLESAESPSSCR